MNKYICILTIVFILLITFPILSQDTLFIGSFAPENEINTDFLINLKISDYENSDLIFKLKSELFIGENGTVPISRLEFLFETQKFVVSNTSFVISQGQLIQDASGYVIPARIKLLPIDKPGLYENILTVKDINGKLLFEKRILFQINSWALFELGNQKYMQIIFSDTTSNKMNSRGDVVLKVASNSNWELYGHINDKGKELSDKLNLYSRKMIGEQYAKDGPVNINSKPKLITSGIRTVSENYYWTEIDIFMEIVDITKIYSGFKEFPVILYLNTKN
ncbi:MAG: hypothetical protein U5K53_00090 [Halanaerobiales bacterium]|nr:hypothetical protein [Halanaerobiales bacterium]